MAAAFKTGDVLSVTFDDRPIRIIQTDPIETFYDAEAEGVGWNLRRARTTTFYRMTTRLLLEAGSFLREEPMSPAELEKFRPDLPMRLFQHVGAAWSDDLSALLALEPDYPVAARQIAIVPFGPRGSAKKARKIVSRDDCTNLSSLIEQAHEVQQALCAEVTGVGIYRSGTIGGIPSYYLWGAVDQAGHAA